MVVYKYNLHKKRSIKCNQQQYWTRNNYLTFRLKQKLALKLAIGGQLQCDLDL